MKVLVISHMYPSTFNKMAGIFVHQQVKALVEQGCEVRVISPVPWAPFPINKVSSKWKRYSQIPTKAIMDNIEVFYPRYIEFPKGFLFHKSGKFMAKGIDRIVNNIYKDFKFDIIHSHVALPDGYASMVINEKYNVPHIVTIHGQDFQNTINRNLECKKALFEVLNKVDKIITVSSKLKNIVKDEAFFHKIEVINNGIDKKYIAEKVEELKGDEINLLSASNLKEAKGIQFNIKAISNLINKYPNIQYSIIGDGEYKNKLLELVEELGLKNNVGFLGKLDYDKVIENMRSCHIFSLPSYKEGFGMVYIEAMAQGKPVIGIKGEGITDVIDNGVNGFLVERENVQELESVLELLIKDDLKRSNIGENAKETVLKNYTWDEVAKRTIKVYKSLIK
ncbi:glycosyltransferase [Clostridium sp. MSJ-11]|uniref:Glycosyltransferase n=1 Tax=Clostridium mobile TaxID=2841512 RepID=A0ABS6EK25_9CLOT|nr:glycosyltransferase [Clostridium mobile]MBU5485487.1 glycosyltransferase [Clostridium mobile]